MQVIVMYSLSVFRVAHLSCTRALGTGTGVSILWWPTAGARAKKGLGEDDTINTRNKATRR